MNKDFFLRRASLALALAAGAVGQAHAAPPRPLIVLFTPGVSANLRDPTILNDPSAFRTQTATLALRDRFEETGLADVVIYAPDSSLFVRAMIEAKLKPENPALLSPSEMELLGKATGATYIAQVFTLKPGDKEAGGSDLELHAEQIEDHKKWRWRSTSNGTGLAAPLRDGTRPAYGVGLQNAANTLVSDFVNGCLHTLAANAPPPLPTEPIPTVHEPAHTEAPAPVPVFAPTVVAATPAGVAPPRVVAPRSAPVALLPSSGLSDENAAEAERHGGDEAMRAGDTGGAILAYRRAISLSPRTGAYRAALARAYLSAGRSNDALSEAKRALTVIPETDRASQIAANRLLAEILQKGGNTTAALNTYRELVGAQPSAIWAKVALADLLASQGSTADAEALYKSALRLDPAAKDALLSYARLLATKGDYDLALTQLTAASGASDPAERYRTAVALFDDGVFKIAGLVEQNRAAWAAKRIGQAVFYKATAAQSARVSGLASLLKAVAPPSKADAALIRAHKRRILAANLLLQGVASLLSQVETGDADAGDQASVYLGEFRKEMTDAGAIGTPGS